MRARTVGELARANGIDLPVPAERLYEQIESAPLVGDPYRRTAVALPEPGDAPVRAGATGLLQAAQWVMPVLATSGDVARVAYESLEDAVATSNVRYRETFFEAAAFLRLGFTYETLVDGLIDGLRAAEADFGIVGRLIAGIDRGDPPGDAVELVEIMAAHPCPEVIGIGLEGSELAGAPERFVDAYRAAARVGLHRTAHAGEHVPTASYVLACLDVLGCERIDHGYFVLEDAAAVRRCADDGVVFTCACTTSRRAWIPWRRESIRRMIAGGLRISLGSDDPGMFPTTLSDEYIAVREHARVSLTGLVGLAANGIDAAWLPETEKLRLHRELTLESGRLPANLGADGTEVAR